jgi:hypothetical protein
MNQCKASKHAALLHGLNAFMLFSTFFFTELLKSGRNYWKQICEASFRMSGAENQKVLMR